MTTSKNQTYTIDQLEGEWAVLEAGVGETFNVLKAWLQDVGKAMRSAFRSR